MATGDYCPKCRGVHDVLMECPSIEPGVPVQWSISHDLMEARAENRLLKASIWKHLHIKHERTVCPLSVGTPERCCEIIMKDAGLNPADGEPTERITVREACRRRMPLGGVDAQALEHGMTQLEEEKRKLQQMYEDLDFKTRAAIQQHPEGCVQSAMGWKTEFAKLQKDLHEKTLELDDLKTQRIEAGQCLSQAARDLADANRLIDKLKAELKAVEGPLRITCDNAYHDRGHGICSFCVQKRIDKVVEGKTQDLLRLNGEMLRVLEWLDKGCGRGLGLDVHERIDAVLRPTEKRKCLCGPEGKCDYHRVAVAIEPVQQDICICPSNSVNVRCKYHGGHDTQ